MISIKGDDFEDVAVDEEQGIEMEEQAQGKSSSIRTLDTVESTHTIQDVAKEQNHYWYIVFALLGLLTITVLCVIIFLPFAIERGSRTP